MADPIIIEKQFSKIGEIIKKPLTAYSLSALLVSVYMILRSFGIDVAAPALDKIGAGSSEAAININGNYVYTSFSLDPNSRNYYHGGYFNITQRVTAYGVTFKLSGYRTWRKFAGKPEEEVVFPWSSDWGGIFDGNQIKFTYRILTSDNTEIKGFVDGDIHTDERGNVEEILCNFNQLPPSDPMFGTMIIKRLDKESPDKNDVYKIVQPPK